MHTKITTKPRLMRAISDLAAAEHDLAEATDRLRKRNEEMRKFLDAQSSATERVAGAPNVSLPDATAQARAFWDARERAAREQATRPRRPSVPPRR